MLRKLSLLLLVMSLLLLPTLGCVGDPIDTLAVTDMWVTNLNGAPYVPGVPVELDPIFTASPSFGITALDIASWNAIVSSQWTTDATGINYQLGNVGIGTPSEATKRLIVFQNTGGPLNTGLEVSANSASAGGYGIYDSVSGAKTANTYGMYIYNSTSSGTNAIDTYGLRIRSDVNWIGVGATNYGLYINEPTGGTANYPLYVAGGTSLLNGVLNMNTHQINNVVDPTLIQDAATKNYADSLWRMLDSGVTWYNSAWKYRNRLTFSNGASADNLVDFPILVHLTTTNFDFTKAKSAGEDIRFSDSNGTSLLNYEIEKWTASTEAWIWVEVPQIDSGSSTDFIYMYYGNPAAADGQNVAGTWNAGFVLVDHMKDDPDTSHINDSTANNNDGTKKAANQPIEATGEIYKGQQYDGTHYITVANSASLNPGLSDLSLEAWTKASTDVTTWRKPISDDDTVNDGYYIYVNQTNGLFFTGGRFDGTVKVANSGVAINDNVWRSLAGTWDRDGLLRSYINGATAGAGTDISALSAIDVSPGVTLYLGAQGIVSQRFIGVLDEIRISMTLRSASWLKATYLTETDAYITFGGREQIP